MRCTVASGVSEQRSAPPLPHCGGRLGRLWMEKAHANHPPLVVDPLDGVSVHLELADDGSREVDPVAVQLGESERPAGRLA